MPFCAQTLNTTQTHSTHFSHHFHMASYRYHPEVPLPADCYKWTMLASVSNKKQLTTAPRPSASGDTAAPNRTRHSHSSQRHLSSLGSRQLAYSLNRRDSFPDKRSFFLNASRMTCFIPCQSNNKNDPLYSVHSNCCPAQTIHSAAA